MCVRDSLMFVWGGVTAEVFRSLNFEQMPLMPMAMRSASVLPLSRITGINVTIRSMIPAEYPVAMP